MYQGIWILNVYQTINFFVELTQITLYIILKCRGRQLAPTSKTSIIKLKLPLVS